MDLIASMLPDRIITKPRAPRMAPQLSLMRTLGLRSPPVENMPSTKAALTTLVTINKKAAITTAAILAFTAAQTASAGNCGSGDHSHGGGYKKAEVTSDSDDRY